MPGFRWEIAHDLALAKETVGRRPQKLLDWLEIAQTINDKYSGDAVEEKEAVQLKGRGCKERMDLLLKKHKAEDSKSLKRSGTEEEYSELSQLLEDVGTFLRDETCAEAVAAKVSEQKAANLKKAADKKKGEDMRRAAMEGLSMTIDLDDSEEEPSCKKPKVTIRASRKRATDLMHDKFEARVQLRKEELQIRREELELQKRKLDMEENERRKRFELEQQERRAMLSLLLKHLGPEQ